jgi:hypothetical protein
MFSILNDYDLGSYNVPMKKPDSPNHTIPHKPHLACLVLIKVFWYPQFYLMSWSTFRQNQIYFGTARDIFVLRLAGAVTMKISRTTSIEKYSYGYAINGYIYAIE